MEKHKALGQDPFAWIRKTEDEKKEEGASAPQDAQAAPAAGQSASPAPVALPPTQDVPPVERPASTVAQVSPVKIHATTVDQAPPVSLSERLAASAAKEPQTPSPAPSAAVAPAEERPAAAPSVAASGAARPSTPEKRSPGMVSAKAPAAPEEAEDEDGGWRPCPSPISSWPFLLIITVNFLLLLILGYLGFSILNDRIDTLSKMVDNQRQKIQLLEMGNDFAPSKQKEPGPPAKAPDDKPRPNR